MTVNLISKSQVAFKQNQHKECKKVYARDMAEVMKANKAMNEVYKALSKDHADLQDSFNKSIEISKNLRKENKKSRRNFMLATLVAGTGGAVAGYHTMKEFFKTAPIQVPAESKKLMETIIKMYKKSGAVAGALMAIGLASAVSAGIMGIQSLFSKKNK